MLLLRIANTNKKVIGSIPVFLNSWSWPCPTAQQEEQNFEIRPPIPQSVVLIKLPQNTSESNSKDQILFTHDKQNGNATSTKLIPINKIQHAPATYHYQQYKSNTIIQNTWPSTHFPQ